MLQDRWKCDVGIIKACPSIDRTIIRDSRFDLVQVHIHTVTLVLNLLKKRETLEWKYGNRANIIQILCVTIMCFRLHDKENDERTVQ